MFFRRSVRWRHRHLVGRRRERDGRRRRKGRKVEWGPKGKEPGGRRRREAAARGTCLVSDVGGSDSGRRREKGTLVDVGVAARDACLEGC